MPTMKTIQAQAQMGEGFRVNVSARGHELVIDQPKMGGGEDTGPTPLEYVLFALGGCICSISRIVAKQRGITLRGVSVALSGELDVDGLLGNPGAERVGIQGFKAEVTLDADMTPAEKNAFLHEVDARCPISENLLATTPVEVVLAA